MGMIRHVLAGSASIVAIALVACSGDDAGASISAEAACDDAAKAYCAKIDECASFFMKLGFGDVATCEQRLKINCVPGFSATGTSATPSRLSQCATDVKATSCDEILGRNLPPSCKTEPGTLAAIRPPAWPQTWTSELLELITVLALLAELRPRREALRERTIPSPITAAELRGAGVLPVPAPARRPAAVLDAREEGPEGQLTLL